MPDYNHFEGTKQRWRDLVGYYTRYGDVRELLAHIDDRYVIMNSGDEMSLRFAEQAAPAAGWTRDYIITGDGWIKDGDFNSDVSRGRSSRCRITPRNYMTGGPADSRTSGCYRHHPADWQNYHTRYVTPDVFQNSLRRGGN